MAMFNYTTAAELSPGAEPLPARGRRMRRQPIGYGRFARAADAIRFAVEELPAELFRDTCLVVGESRFGRDEIRRLYESSEYPFARRATTPGERRKQGQ
jgi:hypothetical protein